jgi:hypothetical protein
MFGLNRVRVTAEALISSRGSSWIYAGQSGTGTGFSPSTSVFACNYCSSSPSYLSSATCSSNKKDKWAKPVTLQKAMLFRKPEVGDRERVGLGCLENYFHPFSSLRLMYL